MLSKPRRLAKSVIAARKNPILLVLLPVLPLAAFWIGGVMPLVVVSIALPFLILVSLLPKREKPARQKPQNGHFRQTLFEDRAQETLLTARKKGLHSALFVISLEGFEKLGEDHGQADADGMMQQIGARFLSSFRLDDLISQIGEAKFAICLVPCRNLDLETCIQKAGRLLSSTEAPVSVDGVNIYLSASVGFCQLSQSRGSTSADWLRAAHTALQEAQRNGPSAIRAFTEKLSQEKTSRSTLLEEVGLALECGQILPWFQPQISTNTGKITGFEALARWSHPTRGLILPAEFLPAIEKTDLIERLGEVMMYHSFCALKAWDAAGVTIPQVGVNFAGSELSNIRLLDKVKWELDRFNLTPDRLVVEILETVVSHAPDDVITRNINALAAYGCQIDLDDFGTGQASISSIRRFSVSRIKIDKSFVIKADRDPDQQRMIGAILTMAERLGVETLAEGVETAGEHALLAQLGCDHVQGYGIAHAMPFKQTLDWICKHNAKLEDVPRIMTGHPK